MAIAWLAAAGWRSDRAETFDRRSEAALQSGDLNRAFRQAQFADVLYGNENRHLAAASLAYLRGDYDSAVSYFARVKKGTQAEIAQAATALAAAADENQDRYDKEIGRRWTIGLAEALAYRASLRAGDVDRLATPCECHIQSRGLAYAAAIGQSPADPRQAAKRWTEATDNDFASVEPPAFRQFLEKALEANDDGKLTDVFGRQQKTASEFTRDLLLAEFLLHQHEPVAAEAYATRAAEGDVTYRDAWNTLAAIQLARGELKQAKESLKAALDLDKGWPETWHLKALLAQAQDDDKDAAEFNARAEALGYGR